MKQFDLINIKDWFPSFKEKPIIISGPCSAETEDQLLRTAHAIAKTGKVSVLRAGIWKPRTRPGSFQGIGEEALKWLKKASEETGLLTTVEVTTPHDIELCLKYGVDILWVGARTVANPINVQELADQVKGIDIPVLVKNPLHPDLAHWIGALERFNKVGIKRLAAIHRGFYPFEDTKLRNIPKWEFPIELKRRYPELPILCDPSHIAGKADLVAEIAQRAMNLNMDGLMIETHYDPSIALSDAEQQLTPSELEDLLNNLKLGEYLNGSSTDIVLDGMREQLDSIDQQLVELLAHRMNIVEKIGEHKCKNNLTIFQLRRWQKTFEQNSHMGRKAGLTDDFIGKMISLIHMESIQRQNAVVEKSKCKGDHLKDD